MFWVISGTLSKHRRFSVLLNDKETFGLVKSTQYSDQLKQKLKVVWTIASSFSGGGVGLEVTGSDATSHVDLSVDSSEIVVTFFKSIVYM